MSEVGEGQHRRWRENITSNIRRGMEAAGDDPAMIVAVTTAANISGSNMMIAERIGQVARALNDRDELVSSLHDENREFRLVTTQLQRAQREGDEAAVNIAIERLVHLTLADGFHSDQDIGVRYPIAVELEGEAPAEAMEPSS